MCLSDGKERPLTLFLSLLNFVPIQHQIYLFIQLSPNASFRCLLEWRLLFILRPSSSSILLCCRYFSLLNIHPLPLFFSTPSSSLGVPYKQLRFSTMPFGCSVLHFHYITLWYVRVQCLQDLLSSNCMLMIIVFFKFRGEKWCVARGVSNGMAGVCVELLGVSAINRSVRILL